MSRFLIFLLCAFLLVIIQSTLISLIFPSFLRPDLMVVLVIFLGISFPLFSGAVLVFSCGLLYDTFSGGTLGFFAFVYLCLYFGLRLLAKFLILGGTIYFRIILVGVLMGVQTLLLVLLPPALGIIGRFPWPPAGWVLPQILVTCLVSWPLFGLFRRVDIPPAEESLPPVS
jgi:cell shape-determining protein MreD